MTAPLPTGSDGQPVQMRGVWSATPTSALVTAPTLPGLYLSEAEAAQVSRLTQLVEEKRFRLELRDAYYRGENRITDLGISIPPQMRGLRVALGWPRVCVEALDERMDIEGFRFPGSPDIDSDLQDIWVASDMDSESQLANLDALVFGQGYAAVGSGLTGPNTVDTPPIITVESPLDLGVAWDARTRSVAAALRLYESAGTKCGTLYLPDETISMVAVSGGWSVTERDRHNLGMTPVVRIANRPRTYDRDGQSQITTEVMSITDAACRTLLGLSVAGEFYSGPQRWILGATESAFQDASGQPKSAWETYLGRVLALERDEEGNLPQVGQFQAYDPSVFTKVIDMYAKIISSITGLPPHVLGYTTDNPASADAIRSSEMRLTMMADRKTRMFGSPWRQVMKLALLIRGGDTPTGIDQLQTVWAATATPTPAATTDAIVKQVQAGIIPARSDVTKEKLGYSVVERERLEADFAADAGEQFLAELARSTLAKEARVDNSLAADVAKPPPTPAPGSAAAGS